MDEIMGADVVGAAGETHHETTEDRMLARCLMALTETAARVARETMDGGGTIHDAATAYNVTLGHSATTASEGAARWMAKLGMTDGPANARTLQ